MSNIFVPNNNFLNLINSINRINSICNSIYNPNIIGAYSFPHIAINPKDDSLNLSDEEVQNIRELTDSDITQKKILKDQLNELKSNNAHFQTQLGELKQINLKLELQLKELRQANTTLNSQLDSANKSIKQKEEMIFNQNVQIELHKTEYLRQVEEAKKQEARAIAAEKEAKKALRREKISYFLTVLAFFIDYRGYILAGLNFIKNILKKS